MADPNIHEIFADWCREADLEPTLARREAFADGYNARVRYDDQRDAEIERLRTQLADLEGEIGRLEQKFTALKELH